MSDILGQAESALREADQAIATGEREIERRRFARRKSDKLACPACTSLQSEVIARHMTREQQLTDGYWRHRRCGRCGCEFMTVETVVAKSA